MSQWSHRELADEIVRRGIIDRISPRHASRLQEVTLADAIAPMGDATSIRRTPTGRHLVRFKRQKSQSR